MKKYLNILFASAAVALAVTSCQKEANVAVESDVNSAGVTFYAESIETKTVFGSLSGTTYPTLWTDAQQVRISQNEAASIIGSVLPDESGASADFKLETDMTSDGSETYKFYAISPAAAQVSDANKTYHNWSLEIPASQTPTADSPDQKAQILCASYDAGETFPTSVGLSFHHLTAYGKISFANLGLDQAGENVTSVVLEAEETLVGRFRWGFNDGSFTAYSSQSNILTINTSETSDIWFACAPAEIAGQELKITVNTDLGSYTRTITVPAGKNFEAGKVAVMTINMAGIAPEVPKVYTLVKSLADLDVDSEVILVSTVGSSSHAAGLLGSNTYLSSQDVTVESETITSPSSAVEVFKVKNGYAAGTVAFQMGSTDGYLTHDSAAKVKSESTVSVAGSWSLSIDGTTGAITAFNLNDVTRYLKFNAGSPRFSTYLTTTSNTESVYIYKNGDTGSGTAITPKAAVSLSISDATDSYSVGDTYSFDGTAELVYSDKTKAVLSSSEIVIDDSGINMSAAGTYTVVVKYAEDPAISATYDITVVAGVAPVTVNTYANTATVTGENATQTATWTNGDITVTAVRNDTGNTKFRADDTDHTRFYPGWTLTVSSASKTISSVEFTCTSNAYATALANCTFTKGTDAASGSVVTVSGVSASSTSVTLGAQVRISSIKVNY